LVLLGRQPQTAGPVESTCLTEKAEKQRAQRFLARKASLAAWQVVSGVAHLLLGPWLDSVGLLRLFKTLTLWLDPVWEVSLLQLTPPPQKHKLRVAQYKQQPARHQKA
jgi:hypothetical protein